MNNIMPLRVLVGLRDPQVVPTIVVGLLFPFRNGMWWSIPAPISTALYEKYVNNEDAVYTWDWGDTRSGSWRPDGEQTRINRYVMDFRAWEQRNIDNNRKRSVRLVWVTAETVDPKWSGQITP